MDARTLIDAMTLWEGTGTAVAQAAHAVSGSWKHTPMRRMRDRADVAELIMRNSLPRDLKVYRAIKDEYLALWDALAAEPPGPPS